MKCTFLFNKIKKINIKEQKRKIKVNKASWPNES